MDRRRFIRSAAAAIAGAALGGGALARAVPGGQLAYSMIAATLNISTVIRGREVVIEFGADWFSKLGLMPESFDDKHTWTFEMLPR